MVGSEHVREEGVDSRREQHASCLAVCLLPFLPAHSSCCFALGVSGLGPSACLAHGQRTWAIVSCPDPS